MTPLNSYIRRVGAMNTILLNGKKMISKKGAHLYLKSMLLHPDYIGNNLDALWDVLSIVRQPVNIILFNKESMDAYLGQYGQSIIEVFKEAAEANNNIKFKVARIRIKE